MRKDEVLNVDRRSTMIMLVGFHHHAGHGFMRYYYNRNSDRSGRRLALDIYKKATKKIFLAE